MKVDLRKDSEVVMAFLKERIAHEFLGSSSDKTFVELVGEMLLVVQRARDDGEFKSLPLADPCHLGIEHQLGGLGWPAYDDRGKLGTTA